MCFIILNVFTNVDPTKLFSMEDSTQTRNNGAILECRQVHSDYTKVLFTDAVVRDWNRFSHSVMQCNSIASFKMKKKKKKILTTISSVAMFIRSVSMLWWPNNNITVLGLGQTTSLGLRAFVVSLTM